VRSLLGKNSTSRISIYEYSLSNKYFLTFASAGEIRGTLGEIHPKRLATRASHDEVTVFPVGPVRSRFIRPRADMRVFTSNSIEAIESEEVQSMSLSGKVETPAKRSGLLGSSVHWGRPIATLLAMLAFAAQSFGTRCAPPGCCGSPIIIDVSGQGFNLTNATNGVLFDISGTGNAWQIGWTAVGSDNAFLALPGSDGLVHNGKELFGNFTPQPLSSDPNGFRALAVYDQPENGGNGDGIIDARDEIFSSLRLWIDTNHDGICQPEELHTLPSLGVYSISLEYWLSRKRDQWGNLFRYRGDVNPPDDPSNPAAASERVTYDVFLDLDLTK
jgi:hypothetical protein